MFLANLVFNKYYGGGGVMLADIVKPTKNPQREAAGWCWFTGGVERIRTAVRGFADRCLTTRPRHLVLLPGVQK